MLIDSFLNVFLKLTVNYYANYFTVRIERFAKTNLKKINFSNFLSPEYFYFPYQSIFHEIQMAKTMAFIFQQPIQTFTHPKSLYCISMDLTLGSI